MECLEYNVFDLQQVRASIDMVKNKELLAMHPFDICQRKDGKYYTYLPDKEKGRVQRKRNTKEEIEKVVIDYWRQQIENPTLEDVFKEWNDRELKNGNIVKSTHSRNKRVFNRHYSAIKDKKIKTAEPSDIADFLENQISEHQLTAKAFYNLITITRGFLTRAARKGWVEFDVESLLKSLDVSENSFKVIEKKHDDGVFTEKEYPMMMEYLCKHPDLRNLGILLTFLTGMRIGELVALKQDDIRDGFVHVKRTEMKYYDDETGKNVYEVKETPKTAAGIRSIPVPKNYLWVLDKLQEYNKGDEYVFSENGKRLTQNCIRQRQYRVCKKIGLAQKSPHKNRATYATMLYESNAQDTDVINLLGHKSIQCTRQYYVKTRRSIEHVAEVVNNIPEFKKVL